MAVFHGSGGADGFFGTSADDDVFTYGGSDRIDVLTGGGADYVDAGSAADEVVFGSGDTVLGGGGGDLLQFGSFGGGTAHADAGRGDDVVEFDAVGFGAVTVVLGSGSDVLVQRGGAFAITVLDFDPATDAIDVVDPGAWLSAWTASGLRLSHATSGTILIRNAEWADSIVLI